MTEPTRPTEIGQLVGENPLNTGRILTELGKGELAVQTDKEQNLWAVTDTGRDYLEEHKQLTESVTESVPLPGKAPEPPPGKETGKKDERKETGETVPSQADLEKERILGGIKW